MSIFLHIFLHFLISLIAGFTVWKLWSRPFPAIISALIGGVAIDFDHLIDYFLAFGFNFNLNYFLNGYEFLKTDKIFLFFHAWEYAALLIILSFFFRNKTTQSIFWGLALGLVLHLAADIYLNHIPASTYSLIYRIENRFEIKNLVTSEHYQIHQVEKENLFF